MIVIQAAAPLVAIGLRTISPKSAKPEEKPSLRESFAKLTWSCSTLLLLVIAFSTLELVAASVRVEFGRRRRDLFIHPSPASAPSSTGGYRHHYELHQIVARLVCSKKPPSIFGLHATADEKTTPWALHEGSGSSLTWTLSLSSSYL